MTASTFERTYFTEPGGGDATVQERLAQEAERDHRDRLAAVRTIAALAADAGEARELYLMLGLTDAEQREARTTPLAAAGKISAA